MSPAHRGYSLYMDDEESSEYPESEVAKLEEWYLWSELEDGVSE